MPAANNAMSGGGGGGGGGRGGWQAGPSVPPAQNANNTWNSAQVKDWQNPPQRPDLINQNLWQQPPGPQQVIVPNQWAQPAPPAPVEQVSLFVLSTVVILTISSMVPSSANRKLFVVHCMLIGACCIPVASAVRS